MRDYSDDCNHTFFRTIIPKYTIGPWGFMLSVCIEHLFTFGSLQRTKFVGVQGRVPEVALKISQALSDGFENISFGGIILNFL